MGHRFLVPMSALAATAVILLRAVTRREANTRSQRKPGCAAHPGRPAGPAAVDERHHHPLNVPGPRRKNSLRRRKRLRMKSALRRTQ
jgi:hypothetical protein